jgi:hypothetical protein
MTNPQKRAVVDTTILVDALLKTDSQRDSALVALASYAQTLLPQYAIKEFKAGALHYYVWYHNKVVEAATFSEAVECIQRNIGRRRNLPATALQALKDFFGSIEGQLLEEVLAKYPGMTRDEARLAELQIWLRQKIARAWRARSEDYHDNRPSHLLHRTRTNPRSQRSNK